MVETDPIIPASAATAEPEQGDRPQPPARLAPWEKRLLLGVLALYLATRFIGLTRFPIYFFCDEAVQANKAADLVAGGLKLYGTFLPPYFRNDQRWNLSLSVYLQVIPVVLFGKSVLVTRATSVIFSTLGVIAIALMLRRSFCVRTWWLSVLLLAGTPVWFLHTRTAFEVVLMVSFYACFLAAYLAYRMGSPKYLPLAVVFGAATFYSYANGQGVMLVTGTLLLLLDFRYHVRTIRSSPRGAALSLALLVLVAVPYVRFRLLNPAAVEAELRTLNSYWLTDLPLTTKLSTFLKLYGQALNPDYWFRWHETDAIRHVIKGTGFVPWFFAPFAAVGFGLALWRSRVSPPHRTMFVAIAASPFSASLVGLHILRILALVVPIIVLTSLGLDALIERLPRRIPRAPLELTLALLLAVQSATLLVSSLRNGPTWFNDYGLYGMQWGAEPLFTGIREELERNPSSTFRVSSSWANNPNEFVPFFIPEKLEGRVRFYGLGEAAERREDLGNGVTYVLPPDEFEAARRSGKFEISVLRTLTFPDDQPRFYFCRVRYVEGIDGIFAREAAARHTLVSTTASLDGERVVVRHSLLDLGTIQGVLGASPGSVARSKEANPFIIEVDFPEPRLIHSVAMEVGAPNVTVTVRVASGAAQPVTVSRTFRDRPPNLPVEVPLPPGGEAATTIRIEILNDFENEPAHVQVSGIRLR